MCIPPVRRCTSPSSPGQRGNPIEQWRKAKTAASDAMVRTGATITHHHAVGADHRPWMRDEVGDLGVRGAAGRQGDTRSGRNPQPRQADSVSRRDIGRVTMLTNPAVGARQRAARGRTGGRPVAASAASTSSRSPAPTPSMRGGSSTVRSTRGMDALVVVGGDGIISLALQVLAHTDIPLGIIPAGTGNDHAREFRIPTKDPEAAADVVVDGWRSRPSTSAASGRRRYRQVVRHRDGGRLRLAGHRPHQPDALAARPDALQPGDGRRAVEAAAAAVSVCRSTARSSSPSSRWPRSATRRATAAAC